MGKTQIYIPPPLDAELERIRVKYGDDRISQTARRLIRKGLETIKVEEG